MAKQNHERESDDKKGSPPEAVSWGTWEELLLAYAVNRFGNSWDSISSELRKRSSASIVFTPKICKQKFQELELRFAESTGKDLKIKDAAAAVPWIDELRELRVAELQRELQNYDVYISSLQSKVKKLTEESDGKSCGERKEKLDLGQIYDEIEIKDVDEANNELPSCQKQVPGVDESERDNQSVNGSNGNLETGADRSEFESSPTHIVDGKPGSSPHSRARLKDSCDGRPDVKEPVHTKPGCGARQAPESIAESKTEEMVKENSDVQSSAGKSKNRFSKADDQVKNSIPVRSLPLIDFLRKVHKLGSAIFQRRLEIQEKLRYKKLIREHIDFEMLQTRLKEGWYSDGNNKFFRDLLLLVNNTCIFFSDESPEIVAAIKLRKFILKEMTSNQKQTTHSKPVVKVSSSKLAALPPKHSHESSDSMLLPKPKLVPPMTASRKHSVMLTKESEKETAMKSRFGSISMKTACGCDDISEAQSDQEHGLTSASENSEVKSDLKKMNNKKPIGSEEKRSAANFLNRMHLKEPDGTTKRSVGRPPKRAATPPRAAGGKRSREWTESESSVSKQAKKRSKR